MCGIIGILSDQPAAPRLVEALKRLEYRGYDSAGIALLEGGKLERLRARLLWFWTMIRSSMAEKHEIQRLRVQVGSPR